MALDINGYVEGEPPHAVWRAPVEKSIRDNPQDFPLLTKYYLNAV